MVFIFGSVKIGTVESGGIVTFGNYVSIPQASGSSTSGSTTGTTTTSNIPSISLFSFPSPADTIPLNVSPTFTQ